MAFVVKYFPETDDDGEWTGVMTVTVECDHDDDKLGSEGYSQVAGLVSRLGLVLQFLKDNPDIAHKFFEYTTPSRKGVSLQ